MASTERDVGVLLTGVGKRYDIVSAFAQHATVIAADPNPLAPAQYAAHHRQAVPRIDDPAYVPALRELCERHNVGAVVPLTDLDIEVLARMRGPAASYRRSSPTRRSRGRRSTSTKPTCCCSVSGCRHRRPCSPASRRRATR